MTSSSSSGVSSGVKAEIGQNIFRSRGFIWMVAIAGLLTTIALASGALRQTRAQSPNIAYPYKPTSQGDATQRLQQEVSFYQARIQQRPDDGLERTSLAQTYLKLARATGQTPWFLLAEKTAQESLAKLPFENEAALLVLAQVAEAKHDFPASIQLAQQVLAQKPADEQARSLLVTSYLAQGKAAEAEAIAQTLTATTPTLNTHLLQALTHASQGEDALAIAQFEQALAREEPDETGSSARLRTLFGRFHAERGDLRQAQRLYRETLKMLPQYPLAMVELAQTETQRGRYRQADQLYSQVFSMGELASVVDHEALEGQAELEALRGDRPRAQQLLTQAEQGLRSHPDLETFGHRRALAEVLLTRGDRDDLPEALALMQQEAKLRRDTNTLDVLAWALMSSATGPTLDTAQLEAAAAIAQEALRQNPRDARLLYRAGLIAQSLGQAQEAERFKQAAERINPQVSRLMPLATTP